MPVCRGVEEGGTDRLRQAVRWPGGATHGSSETVTSERATVLQVESQTRSHERLRLDVAPLTCLRACLAAVCPPAACCMLLRVVLSRAMMLALCVCSIQKELAEVSLDPPMNSSAGPKEDNIYEWVATISQTNTATQPTRRWKAPLHDAQDRSTDSKARAHSLSWLCDCLCCWHDGSAASFAAPSPPPPRFLLSSALFFPAAQWAPRVLRTLVAFSSWTSASRRIIRSSRRR